MTRNVQIRVATLADARELSELIYENAFEALAPCYSKAQWSAFKMYYSSESMQQKIENQIVLCAILSGSIVGTIALHDSFVVGFYVKLKNLKQGIGKLLMRHIEEVALKMGMTSINLAASPAGLPYYYKNGWQQVSDIEIDHHGVKFEETLMRKDLL